MSTREEWLAARQTGIGGSDAAGIVGLDPYCEPWDVWDTKVLPLTDDLPTADTQRGRALEPLAVAEYCARTGHKVRRQPMRRHHEHEWMIGNVDRQILLDERGPGVLEVKCPRIANFYRARDEGLPYPAIIQMQHYLAVYGYAWGVFVLFTAEYWDLLSFEVARDEEIISWLIDQEGTFWREHVVPKVRPTRRPPPPPRIPTVPGEAKIRTDAEWLDAARDYVLRDFDLGEAQRDLAMAQERLEDLAGEDTHVVGGGVVLRRSSRAGRRQWDRKAFLAAWRLAAMTSLEALAAVDPEAYYYTTDPKDRVDIVVTDRALVELEVAT